jgi:nucleoside-diphosphate-sugar epimerase
MKMELAVQDVQKAGKIETVVIRPPWFYGPLQPPRQTLFFEMIRDGKGPVVGSGNNRRSMAYIDNLAQGLLLAEAVERANGQVYWIADLRPYTMNEVLDTVERLLEGEFGMRCAHKRLKLPGLASEIAWLVDWSLQALGLYHQKIHVLSEMNKTIACSVEKARRELGYEPEVALEEGMRRSIAWCIAEGLLLPASGAPAALPAGGHEEG